MPVTYPVSFHDDLGNTVIRYLTREQISTLDPGVAVDDMFPDVDRQVAQAVCW